MDLALKPIGLDKKLSKVLGYLKGAACTAVLLVGPAGIGKTTLLKELQVSLLNDRDFATVIVLQVGKEGNIWAIQQKIAEQLMIDLRYFNKMNTTCRAVYLKSALSKGAFVIMLDDVWYVLDLAKIGIPRLRGRCNIVFATRLKSIAMASDPTMTELGLSWETVEMEYLDTEKSLELFNAACGNKHIKYKEIARKIVRKCGGLPLAVVNVGNAASNQSNLETIDEGLTKAPAKISGMEENVFKVLKSTLDYFDDKEIRSCFLFCALFREFKDVNKRELYGHWASGGLLSEDDDGKRIIGKLLDACLLEEGRDEEHVSMHNMVHAMVKWLATGGGSDGYQIMFHSVGGLDNVETFIEKMKEVEWASLLDIDMEKLIYLPLDCPRLSTLSMGLYDGRQEAQSRALCHYQLLQQGQTNGLNCKRYHLSEAFFQNMPSLRVVDLTGHPILHLPDSLGRLEHVSYLNLSWTFIQQIPLELARLVTLRFLDLSHTPFLSSIPKGIITRLSDLRSLKIFNSSYARMNEEGEMTLAELVDLSHLIELQVSLQDGVTIAELFENHTKLLPRITSLHLAFVDYLLSRSLFEDLEGLERLKILSIKSCQFTDEQVKLSGSNHTIETVILQDIIETTKITIPLTFGIRKLHISQCSELKDLTCLCRLQNLRILEIEECEGMVELVKQPHVDEGAADYVHEIECWRLQILRMLEIEECEGMVELVKQPADYVHENHTECFSSLRSLRLDHLPELRSISHCSLTFPLLETIFINECPELKKLPMASSTKSERKIKISCEVKWWYCLNWEDNDVKYDFLPRLFFPHNDDKDAKLGGLISELEDSMSKLKINTKEKKRVEEVMKNIEQMKGLMSCGNNHKFCEHDVEQHREQVETSINTARELLSEMSDWNGYTRKRPRLESEVKDWEDEKPVKRNVIKEGSEDDVQMEDLAESQQGKECRSDIIVGEDVSEKWVDNTLHGQPVLHAEKLSEVMNYLTEDANSVIVIAGAAGVGKTTLLAEVMNAAVGSDHFGNVIFVDAFGVIGFTEHEVFAQITPQVVGLECRDQGSPKGGNAWQRLERTRNLFFIDDVAVESTLHEVVGCLQKITANYKVVIATQEKSICRAMRIEDVVTRIEVVEMKFLDQVPSWQLFLESAGANKAILKDMDIQKVARDMVERCGGLPLALSVVGGNARRWTSRADWDSAGVAMKNSPTDIPGMEDWVFDVILGELQDFQENCLLHWALFPKHKLVNRDHLVGYWIGEQLITALTDNYLLEEVGEELLIMPSVVHSAISYRAGALVVRDDDRERVSSIRKKMAKALWASIKASRTQRFKVRNAPNLDTLLIESPTHFDASIKFPSSNTLMLYAMQESRKSMRDSVLHHQQDIIHDHFFSWMLNLTALDMTGLPILHLPKSVCGLKLLKYLNLSWTFIQELPVETAHLSELSTLDLSFTEFLTSIPRQAILCLVKLHTLKLYCSGYRRFDDEGEMTWNDLFWLRSIKELELPYIQKVRYRGTWQSIKRLSLDNMSLDKWELSLMLRNLKRMRALSIKSCQGLIGELKISDIETDILVLCDLPMSKINLPINAPCALREIHIHGCVEFSDLDCLCMLQQLRVFGIHKCPAIKWLLQPTRKDNHDDHERCLPQLEYMTLERLPSLESISDCALTLGSLVSVRVIGCPKLKKIPLARGRKRDNITIYCTTEWWDKLDWDSPEIKSSFMPQYVKEEDIATGWLHKQHIQECNNLLLDLKSKSVPALDSPAGSTTVTESDSTITRTTFRESRQTTAASTSFESGPSTKMSSDKPLEDQFHESMSIDDDGGEVVEDLRPSIFEEIKIWDYSSEEEEEETNNEEP